MEKKGCKHYERNCEIKAIQGGERSRVFDRKNGSSSSENRSMHEL